MKAINFGFSQLRKPNPNSKTNPNPIGSALCDWPNIAQVVKCCETDKLISGTARLVKHTFDQMCAIAIPSEAIHSRKINFLSKLQLSHNVLFKTFTKSISEELASFSFIYAAIYWNIITDIGRYFYFFSSSVYFILFVWLIFVLPSSVK